MKHSWSLTRRSVPRSNVDSLRISKCDKPISVGSKGELNPMYLLCWRRCRPKVSPSWGRWMFAANNG